MQDIAVRETVCDEVGVGGCWGEEVKFIGMMLFYCEVKCATN